jgi:putative transposase
MDNLRVHKVKGVEEMIEAVGARVVYLSLQLSRIKPAENIYGGN